MVDLLVTYMEMTEPPSGEGIAARLAGATVGRETLDIGGYVSLYRAVGEPLQWDQRLRMEPRELERLLASPATHVHVLRVDGEAAGLCEFNGVGQSVVELTHFGLVPAFQGRRLGPFLLDRSLRAVWSYRPERLWLHTDTYDHPNAQPVYRRAGFKAYAEQMETLPD
ncbi:MAG: GNAT family N-acetyltransferase [Mesorhizobium sp.]|uniref:GNAT family N-acetyltransferase n=1 Tax=unclassified Mesorhizobium TaxID=325217 RepID=UPI000F7630FC|nr:MULTISPECIES: GNAT family N-acetyltransferase [unclassified Mesorhizobium]AZO46857.1 GNAT family N-acetyltransferase [Mesorhizobium sp. M4B.F.Ca.ET.058.02.1.1]RWC52522.1 MAG: GNAT family N-acetyltransferase [Mesorhizobium sp.]RWD00283.1 MAG: GNAT family N-acetyltransferase [Mesorhizobium sp.]RWD10584.1 MAG: GNAT family N-acetyltransferase [Mesorhizobium sp.]RWD59074.1 MAG: GNAT family N-acetyltransferase [Mesorhizobium sp.]